MVDGSWFCDPAEDGEKKYHDAPSISGMQHIKRLIPVPDAAQRSAIHIYYLNPRLPSVAHLDDLRQLPKDVNILSHGGLTNFPAKVLYG